MNAKFFISLIFIAVMKCGNTVDATDLDYFEYSERISKMNLTDTNEVTALISEIFNPFSDRIRTLIKDTMKFRVREPRADFITCDVCKPAVPLLRLLRKLGVSSELLITTITNVCLMLDLAPDPSMCEPTIRSYAEPTLYILENRPDLKMVDFCGILNPGCTTVNPDLTDWVITVDANKPPVVEQPTIPATVTPAQVLQFTDIHLDLEYMEGMTTKCVNPTCCRESDGPPESEGDAAGPYGSFSCEMPISSLRAMFEYASKTYSDAKYILLTGDYIHSLVWLYGKEHNTLHIEAVTTLLREYFPNTPVYPVTGNHETDVVNMYPPNELWDKFDLTWMYNAVVAPFEQYLPADELATFKQGGYYSVSPQPGFRLVVLNTNLCYVNNFWLVYDAIDPENQLQWFAETMIAAERVGEKVHIVGHILPGSSSCWPVWSKKFDAIINRFEGIILAQFYGHSHTEFITLAFEERTQRPTSVSYSTPSAVTDGMHNGFKVFLVDGNRGEESTWQIMNHETWILNVTKSNADKSPAFERMLNAVDDYGLTSFTPKALYDFILQMINDDDLFQKYHRNYYKGISPRYQPCTENECKALNLCEMVTAVSGENSHCEHIRQLIDGTATAKPKPNDAMTSKSIYGLLIVSLIFLLVSYIH